MATVQKPSRPILLNPLKAFASGFVLTLTTLTLTQVSVPRPVRAELEDSPKVVLDEAWQLVNEQYVDPQFNQVNWQKVRQELLSRTYSSRESAYTALESAIERLNDPYTRFLNPQEFQALKSGDIEGELIGVGLQLQVDSATGFLEVKKVLDASPAQRAGIRSGDRILQVNGQSTKGMSLEKAVGLIKGKENTTVQLAISRKQQPLDTLTLTRQRIEVPVVSSALRQESGQRIGYIRLEDFSGHAAEQMQRAIATLSRQQVDRFVLDLRGNPGGRFDQAAEIARMWLNRGAIVRIAIRNGDSATVSANGTALTNLPLTVLVDEGSASASEILAGALKDNGRAAIVGTKTYGKALVQIVNPLSDGSGLNVTIARYYTPSGLDINHRGIIPDTVVSLTEAQRKALQDNPEQIGTIQDPQFAKAIAFDRW